MFTGIIEATGTICGIERKPQALRLTIKAPGIVADCKVGDSICVNGVCLTVTRMEGPDFSCDVVEETLRRSNLSEASMGSVVNLERSLRLDSRLGGHFVMGHVDTTGIVDALVPEGGSVLLFVHCPSAVARYLVEKGSVAVNGVSLTVAAVEGERFSIALIPHTREITNLGQLKIGSSVNLEVDVIAKYVEKLAQPFARTRTPEETESRLRELLESR